MHGRGSRHECCARSGARHAERGHEVPAIQRDSGFGFLVLLDRCPGIEHFNFFAGHCVGLLVN